ncbi:uncharacterized protein LY89DRAFT_402950 [Mollisia scopiformis]|uniref:Uncharacterized protein n=1 Tax=Mollisia scopiformis TaxID=149040 RepID=A0A132B2P6_MOLSC|nr:uncharacterized protein LY89DRAFT_402950 [Mollisia scopiformis]KUJ06670.1 hypothetical protein LY89DRAFT_402950 [Mollisia scopiformis]
MTMSLSLSKSSTDTHFYFVDMYTSETLKPTGTASTVDSSPSGYLSLIRSKPPFCVNVINSTCTSLYAASQQCWSEAFPPGPQMCLCNSLSLMNCTQICQSTPDDRVSYYDWAIELCKDYTRPLNSSINATFVSIWPEVQDRSYSILQDLYPFAWRLSPTDNKKLSQCPSKALNLASFAINNAIVGVGTWFLGRRKLIKRLASGLRWFTKAAYGVAGSKSWPAISIIVVAINVFANFINAVLAKRTAGFSSPDIGTLIRLWATRPRLAFIATAISPVQKEQSMYISAGVSTLLSEVMLQTIGGVVFIQVISFFTTRGYLQVKALQYVFGSWSAMLVYSSALIWVISISFFYIYVVWKYLIGARVSTLVFLALWNFLKSYSEISWNTLKYTLEKIVDLIQRCFRAHSDLNTEEEGYSMDDLGEVQAQPYQTKGWVGWLEQMGLGGDVLKTVSQAYIVLLLPYISQWLFWIGFVELYRDRYCVPVLWQMTLVWSVFDLICILLSATH